MSLTVEVKVNKDAICFIEATRLTGMYTPSKASDVNTYQIVKVVREEGVTDCGHVVHRYGDGANVLAQKALEQAQKIRTAP